MQVILVVDIYVFIAYCVFVTIISNPIACVEQFHILFLDQLGRKLDKRHYALKDGCNLRFYLKSIRYSEDMDIDISVIPVATLQDCVEHILNGKSFSQILQARGLKVSRYSASKQTETTQRWKMTLESKEQALSLHTKIEFSRRGLDDPVVFEPVDSLLIRTYQMTPFMASHYPPETAFRQKVNALAHRSEPQARDIFDLDHLLRSGVSVRGMVLPAHWQNACDNAMSISFDVFKAQVLAYLHPDYQVQYNDPTMWDEMVLRVVEALKEGVA